MRKQHFSTEVHKNLNIKKVPLPYTLNLLVDRILPKECDKIIKSCEKNERLYSFGEQVKNLVGAEKTDWNILQNENVKKDCEPIIDSIGLMTQTLIGDGPFITNFKDFWYARYTDDSFIAPHNHRRSIFDYSFCVYLNAPEEGTYLYFMNEAESVPVKFYKGDIVLFPGNLVHWSNDVSKGRKIIAGNFSIKNTEEQNNG